MGTQTEDQKTYFLTTCQIPLTENIEAKEAAGISCRSALPNLAFFTTASQLLTLLRTSLLMCIARASLSWKKSITSMANS